jgi:hypothetical protein
MPRESEEPSKESRGELDLPSLEEVTERLHRARLRAEAGAKDGPLEPTPILQSELPDVPEWEFKKREIPGQLKVDTGSYLTLGVGLSAGYSLIGSTVFGWLIGKLIDQNGGFLAQAIGTLLGAILGLVSSVILIIRAQAKDAEKK